MTKYTIMFGSMYASASWSNDDERYTIKTSSHSEGCLEFDTAELAESFLNTHIRDGFQFRGTPQGNEFRVAEIEVDEEEEKQE